MAEGGFGLAGEWGQGLAGGGWHTDCAWLAACFGSGSHVSKPARIATVACTFDGRVHDSCVEKACCACTESRLNPVCSCRPSLGQKEVGEIEKVGSTDADDVGKKIAKARLGLH